MFDRSKLTREEFVNEVGRLCQAGESGTIFIVTSQNQQAKMILKDGRIIAAFLRPLSGVDVINTLAKERELSFAFNNNVVMDVPTQVLPDTPSLLDFLKNSIGSMPGFAPAATASGQGSDANLVRQVLSEEATEFLGPIAGPICDEYLQKFGGTLSRQEILQVVDMLNKDIGDATKSARFNQAVRARLKL